jgi:glycosyltransferase involved in cell wall biosynthesis
VNDMSDKPLVSAIIIFLNAERFIDESIESVFGQTYKDWELLLVDDGSTDNSTEIALHFAKQRAGRVRYLEHPAHENRGMSASRNLGIRHARGEYIGFLDADDVWLPHKLERQIAILNAHPEAGMIYGSPQLWHGWTEKLEDIQRDCLQDIGVPPDTVVSPPRLLTLFLARKAITPAPSDVLLRREIVEGLGGFEDSFRGIYEDQVFFAKVCLKIPVFVSGECWDRHRQHRDSACSVWRRTGEYYSAEAGLKFLSWIEGHLLSGPRPENTEVWTVLQKALFPYRQPIVYRFSKQVEGWLEHLKNIARRIARHTLPTPAYRWLRARLNGFQVNKF